MPNRFEPRFQNVSDVSQKMCRNLAGHNVSQRAPRVALKCVVHCVANCDTCDTLFFSVNSTSSIQRYAQIFHS